MIRPEFIALLRRFSEVLWALAVLAFGLWLIVLGGYLLTPVGTAIAAFGVAWGILALRRLRFVQTIDSPGVVEVDEGQIGYLGPQSGGYVSIPELVELRLLSLRGRRVWRLKQADGQALLIPVDASGADKLFDAFASLPGMNTLALVSALDPSPSTGSTVLSLAATTQTIWHRKTAAALPGQNRPDLPENA
ncbi:MAG: hypothetical protein CFE33_15755 [Pseudorhodobacter sp. PARRP1]|nr:MAG: hypothetical protein CFE33_15755 [Pseudorhodobacter sp. PARRP1]